MKTYPLTPQQFATLRTRLLEAGVTLPSDNQGVLSFRGIELKYNYDGATLTLSILKRPWIFAPSLIWQQVDGWIGQG